MDSETTSINNQILNIKKKIIKLSDDTHFLEVKKDETWIMYLDRIMKIKKPNGIIESFLFISIISESFNLDETNKSDALKKLGFMKRS